MSRVSLLLLCVSVLWAAAGATCNARPVEDLPKGHDPMRGALAVGDVVDVQVFNEAELSGPRQVEASGTIRMPLIGDVDAAGLTLDRLQADVQAKYNAKYLKNGQVSIKLLESTTLTVYVLGQVARPVPIRSRVG